MLDICYRWGVENHIVFNSSKSQFIIFHGKGVACPRETLVNLGDETIPLVQKVTHLGHILRNDLRSFNAQFYLLVLFQSLGKIDIFLSLVNTFSTMVLKVLIQT